MAVMFSTKKKQKEPQIDRRRSLAGVPIVNENVKIDDSDEDNVVVSVTFERGNGFLDRFKPAVMTSRVELDELGSFALHQIDGKKTVADIIDAFVERYRANRREMELSVVAFMKSLMQRRVISILIK